MRDWGEWREVDKPSFFAPFSLSEEEEDWEPPFLCFLSKSFSAPAIANPICGESMNKLPVPYGIEGLAIYTYNIILGMRTISVTTTATA